MAKKRPWVLRAEVYYIQTDRFISRVVSRFVTESAATDKMYRLVLTNPNVRFSVTRG